MIAPGLCSWDHDRGQGLSGSRRGGQGQQPFPAVSRAVHQQSLGQFTSRSGMRWRSMHYPSPCPNAPSITTSRQCGLLNSFHICPLLCIPVMPAQSPSIAIASSLVLSSTQAPLYTQQPEQTFKVQVRPCHCSAQNTPSLQTQPVALLDPPASSPPQTSALPSQSLSVVFPTVPLAMWLLPMLFRLSEMLFPLSPMLWGSLNLISCVSSSTEHPSTPNQAKLLCLTRRQCKVVAKGREAGVKQPRFKSRSLPDCVTLDKVLNLSEPQFPPLYNWR